MPLFISRILKFSLKKIQYLWQLVELFENVKSCVEKVGVLRVRNIGYTTGQVETHSGIG